MELVYLLLRQLHALLGENGRPGPRPDTAWLPMLLISLLVDSSIPEENTRTADCRAARCAVARETSGLSASCHRSTEATTHRPAFTAITGGEIGRSFQSEGIYRRRAAPWGLVCPLVSFTMKF